jgi:hypothetical protein
MKHSGKIWATIAGALLIAVVGGAAKVMHRGAAAPNARSRFAALPTPEEIEKITVRINDNREHYGIAPIPEFSLHPRFFPIVLDSFTPAETLRQEYGSVCEDTLTFGEFKLATKSGRIVTIVFCDSGKCRVAFTVDGLGCMRGGEYCPSSIKAGDKTYEAEGWLIYDLLRSIHDLQATGSG